MALRRAGTVGVDAPGRVWKRIVPYGLTEPRVLGLVLGFWLLAIALLFAARAGTSIRIIPISLAGLLLLTLYGPVSLTRVSISSQGRRLERLLRAGHPTDVDAREASAALRFLIDHRAGDEIAARIGRPLPPIDWKSTAQLGSARDSLGRRIMALRDVEYVPDYGPRSGGGWFQMTQQRPAPGRRLRLGAPGRARRHHHSAGRPGFGGCDWPPWHQRRSGPRRRRHAGVRPPAAGAGRRRATPASGRARLRDAARRGGGGQQARRALAHSAERNAVGGSVLVTYWSGWVLVGRR